MAGLFAPPAFARSERSPGEDSSPTPLRVVRSLASFWLPFDEASCGRFVFRLSAGKGGASQSTRPPEVTERILEAVHARFDQPGLLRASVMKLADDGIVVDWLGDRKAALAAIHDLGRGPVLEFRMADTSGVCLAAADALLVALREEGAAASIEREVSNGRVQLRSRSREDLVSFLARLEGSGSVPEGRTWFVEEGSTLDVPVYTAWCLKQAEITDSDVARAQASVGEWGDWYVMVTFTESAAERFAALTRENVDGYLAIVVEGVVVSVPVIKEEIAGGRAQITLGRYGPETKDLAEGLARQLERGGFPLPLVLEQELSPPTACDLLVWLGRLPPLPEPMLVLFDLAVRLWGSVKTTR
ncbi:MAG: hypothetical protein FJ109_12820 [Deltaproteobacteria bacterium]|nr:hypothetical protein [Deltaproteobacteria bacterium]